MHYYSSSDHEGTSHSHMASSKFKDISLVNFKYIVLIEMMIWFFVNVSLMITNIQGHGDWYLINLW
jgi:hypothetical protein